MKLALSKLLWSSNSVQLVERLPRERELRGCQIFAQVRDARGTGDEQNIGRTLQQPGERDLHGCGLEPCGDVRQRGRLQRSESSQGKERDVGYALPRQLVDQGIVGPM